MRLPGVTQVEQHGRSFPSLGPRVARFIEAFCRLPGGVPLRLLEFQRRLLNDLFEIDPATGLRRHRIAYLGLPRKNGKSTLLAAVSLYCLLADGEPGAEVYGAAGDRQQARIVFDAAREMAQADRELAAEITVRRNYLETRDGSVYRVLSADARLQQGLTPSHVLFDEVHVQRDRELWTALTLGSGTRRQPLVIGITTAGYDEGTLAYELYDYGLRVERGEVDDPSYLFRWWEPSRPDGIGDGVRPEPADHTSEDVWRAANPALREPGGFLRIEDFRAVLRHTPENEFRRYRLNSWTQAETAWLPAGAWEDCRVAGLAPDEGLPLYVGVDASLRNDTTAVVGVQQQGDRLAVVAQRYWANPYPESDLRHARWQVPILEVEQTLRELARRFRAAAASDRGRPLPGPAIAYDPRQLERVAAVLRSEGVTMVEVPAQRSRWVPLSAGLYEAIVTRRLAHDGHPVLTQHIRNVARDERADGWTMGKQDPHAGRRPTDAAMALAMAVGEARVVRPAPRTTWLVGAI